MKIKWGGVNRSTPIDLKTLDSEIANIAGRSPRTPIGMKELWDEVQSLKTTMKQWEVVTLKKIYVSDSIARYEIPQKNRDWKWIVMQGTLGNGYGIQTTRSYSDTYNENSVYVKRGGNEMLFGQKWTLSGNYIQGEQGQNGASNTITVLFYK